jgi:hypothetical protein
VPITTFTAGTRILSADVNANFALCLTKEAVTTSGAILFGSGTRIISEDATQLFYDDVNNYVGIGTNSPQRRLHVVDDTTQVGRFERSSTATTLVTNLQVYNPNTTANNYEGIGFVSKDTGGTERTFAAIVAQNVVHTTGAIEGDLAFYTSSGTSTQTEQVRIKSSGFVGIGLAPTYAISAKLHSYDATSNTVLIEGDSSVIQYLSRYSTDASAPDFIFRKQRGTKASATTVASSDIIGRLMFQVYGGTNYRNIAYIQSNVGTYASDSDISSYMSFYTTPTGSVTAAERMRIDAAGNVGIGTTAPGVKFEVKETASAIKVNSSTTGNAAYILLNNSADSRNGYLYATGLGLGVVQADNVAGSYVYFSTKNTQRAYIDDAGNFGIGLTPTTRNNTRLQIVDGIGFPAAQVSSTDVNTLDDYEEGTFTPTLTALSGSITTVGATTGKYTKIGNTVFVTMYLPITTNGTGATGLNVSNLPFTSNAEPHIGCGREMLISGKFCQAYITASSTQCVIYTYDALYPGGSGTAVSVNIQYRV